MLPVSARQAVVGLVVVVLFLFAHAGALDNGFHYDDIHSVVENLELDPTSAETHYNLGNLYHRERRFGDADRQYSLALRYNGAHHGAAYNLAELKLSAMGQAEATEQICRQMLALESLRHTPGETKFFYLLARALDAQEKTVEALTNYRIFLRFRAAQAPLLEWVQNRIEQLKASHR
jgi:cytochrome c-type biogenesis protein CcmH/NrfG